MNKDKQKIRTSYINGFSAGRRRGFDEGYKIAHENITRHLESILKWRKQVKFDKQLPIICSNCLVNIRTKSYKPACPDCGFDGKHKS